MEVIDGMSMETYDRLDVTELALRFSYKKLPMAFSDFRLTACHGANVDEAYGEGWWSVSPEMNGRMALGQRFANALGTSGFTDSIVTAYRGNSLIAKPEVYGSLFLHQMRAPDGASSSSEFVRSMNARQKYTPGL
jgi:hypothetical protein